ncbi:hypothetical protein N9L08_07555, partial [Rhodobacteraceae bacterium]|nr:hypothetical protein [Paracoccaceae bacterium]
DPFQRLLLKVGFDDAALRFVIATERRAGNAPSETVAGFTALRSHWGTVRHWEVWALNSHSLRDHLTAITRTKRAFAAQSQMSENGV